MGLCFTHIKSNSILFYGAAGTGIYVGLCGPIHQKNWSGTVRKFTLGAAFSLFLTPFAQAVNFWPTEAEFVPVTPTWSLTTSLSISTADSLHGIASLTSGNLTYSLTDGTNAKVLDDSKAYIWNLGAAFDPKMSLDQITIWGNTFVSAGSLHYNYAGQWQVSSDNLTWYPVGAATTIKFSGSSNAYTRVVYSFQPNAVTSFQYVKYQGTATQSMIEADLFTSIHGPTWGDWDGDWSDLNNWTVNHATTLPDPTWTAKFNNTSTLRTIQINSPAETGSMLFDSAASYQFQGTQPITLHSSTGESQLTIKAGTQTIATPLILANPTTCWLSNFSSTLHLTNTLTTGAGHVLTINGPGRVTLDTSATLHDVVLNTGSLVMSPALPASTPQVLRLDHLTIAHDNISAQAHLDLGDATVVITAPNITELRQLLNFSYSIGTWQSKGITSSSVIADPHKSLGYFTGHDYRGMPVATLDPATLADTDVVLLPVLTGDLNLDGQINAIDYTQLDAAYLVPGNNYTWINGDLNYDGTVDYRDFALMDAAYQYWHPAAAASLIVNHELQFGEPYCDYKASIAVPEPTSTLLFLPGLLLLNRRRARRSR